VEVVQSIGCDPVLKREGGVRLITGNGVVIAPLVSVEWLNVFGHQIEGLKVVAHTIPFSQFFDGLLGIDVLAHLQAQIDVREATIDVAE
jgi:hypothetical protein